MTISDLEAFEAWYYERVGITYAEAERRGVYDLRTVKAAYAVGLTRGTLEAVKEMSRPLVVDLPAPLVRIGWRWKYRPDAPTGHQYGPIFTDDKPGPPCHAIAGANNSTFGPVTVQSVYVLGLADER